MTSQATVEVRKTKLVRYTRYFITLKLVWYQSGLITNVINCLKALNISSLSLNVLTFQTLKTSTLSLNDKKLQMVET